MPIHAWRTASPHPPHIRRRTPRPQIIMPTGYVIEPHNTGSGGGTSKIRVNNSNSGTSYQIQWRFTLGTNPYSPWLGQNYTQNNLPPGDYTIDFKMKNAGSGHTAPPDEPVTLATNELETLTVAWS